MVGKVLHSKERALVLKVLAFFEHEKEAGKLVKSALDKQCMCSKISEKFMIPVDQPINRTCAATGVSKSTLMRIRKQVNSMNSGGASTSDCDPESIPRPSTPGKKRRPSARKITLNEYELAALRNIVNSFYAVKEVPTLNKILEVARRDLNFPGGKTTIRLILKNQLGYKFKDCKAGGGKNTSKAKKQAELQMQGMQH